MIEMILLIIFLFLHIFLWTVYVFHLPTSKPVSLENVKTLKDLTFTKKDNGYYFIGDGKRVLNIRNGKLKNTFTLGIPYDIKSIKK